MDNLIVSGRGQVTLPAKLRKRLGIEPGGILIAEEKDGALVLRPAMVMPVEIYSDEDVARWVKEDAFKNDAERREFDRKLRALAKRVGKKSPRTRKAARCASLSTRISSFRPLSRLPAVPRVSSNLPGNWVSSWSAATMP